MDFIVPPSIHNLKFLTTRRFFPFNPMYHFFRRDIIHRQFPSILVCRPSNSIQRVSYRRRILFRLENNIPMRLYGIEPQLLRDVVCGCEGSDVGGESGEGEGSGKTGYVDCAGGRMETLCCCCGDDTMGRRFGSTGSRTRTFCRRQWGFCYKFLLALSFASVVCVVGWFLECFFDWVLLWFRFEGWGFRGG